MAIITQPMEKAVVGRGALGVGFSYQAEAFGDFTYYYAGQADTYGAVQHTSGITLPRNGLVEKFDALVTAARATAAKANVVAQVRAGPSSDTVIGDKGLSVVVDFGTPRTVSAVSVPSPYQIAAVKIWNGAQFVQPGLYRATLASSASPPHNLLVTPTNPTSTPVRAVLSAEPRTERLLIEVASPTNDAGPLIEDLGVALPDAPGDLELRINGGAPAWLHPGPVAPGQGTTRSDAAWNDKAERIIHLADALRALTGDPTASDEATFELRLTSRSPGLLKVEELSREIRRIRRATFDGRATTTIGFDEEGAVDLALNVPGLPVGTTVFELRLTMEGDFEKERILPPIGPQLFPTVDLRLDQERAVLIRLAADTGLSELTGLRLPLAASDDGAELRVVLWSNADVALPAAPLDDATSEPLVLDAGSADAFRTFRFEAPVPLDAENPPWAAILATRGQAILSVAQSTGDSDPVAAQIFRLGPHAGPWMLPPAGLRAGALAAVRARGRMIGTAPKNAPIAPVTAAVLGGGGGAVELFPARKPTTLTIPGGAGGTATLRFVARAAGTLTLRDVDIVSAE